ncbi:MAG: cyclic nucleotide-binding domain-containing protein [Deltaproteobacteria bacterium]|nr:cyclic nucleotide-binding domain-containing protein [Deltaproteobacteria bacterium]
MMAANEDKADFLAGSPVFKDLPREALEAIAGVVKPLVVPRDTTVIKEGDPGDSLYIIRSGSVRIVRRNPDGLQLDISIKGPGETFGEMALVTGEPRSADVETLGETHLLALSKDDYDRIVRDFPDLSKVFTREMRRWLSISEKRIEIQAREVRKSLRMTWVDFVLVIVVIVILGSIFNVSNPNGIPFFPEFPERASVPSISQSAAWEEFHKGETLFLDARPANFYNQRHIQGAVNIPLPLFEFVYLMTFPKEDKGKKIIIYGGTISRLYDLEVAQKLLLRGYEKVRILEGGLAPWEGKGYPVAEKEKG